MSGVSVESAEVLWDGPLFADEVGWSSGITDELRAQYSLESFRIVPAREASAGVCTIYFRRAHREWALVRYATRYRWIFEILLRSGLSGERRLLRQGLAPADIQFLTEIVPVPDSLPSPSVYDILWRSAPYPEYARVVEEIVARNTFVPVEILSETPGLSVDDAFTFESLIRSHLIERTEQVGDDGRVHRRSRRRESAVVALEATYRPTPEGVDALPTIPSEYERIFEAESFEPLRINPDHEPDEHVREAVDRQRPTSAEEPPEVDTSDVDVLEEIERDLESLTDGESSQ